MPELRVSLSEYEFELLKKVKGKRTWKEFLVSLARNQEQLLVNEINEFFFRLKSLDPENHEFYEIMRVSLIAFIKDQRNTAMKMLRKTIDLLSKS